MSQYGFRPCSCGSRMLKPTERPPPSFAPRFAASITPGPPPITSARPASARSRAVCPRPRRWPSPRRPAPSPKTETAGRSIRSNAGTPPGTRRRSARCRSRTSLRSTAGGGGRARCSCSQPVLRDVRREHACDERHGRHDRGDGHQIGEPPGAPGSTAPPPTPDAPRAEHMAAVEDPDRREVDQVEQEAGVGERAQQVGIDGHRRRETGAGTNAAGDRPGERDPGVDPRVEAHVPQRDVRRGTG